MPEGGRVVAGKERGLCQHAVQGRVNLNNWQPRPSCQLCTPPGHGQVRPEAARPPTMCMLPRCRCPGRPHTVERDVAHAASFGQQPARTRTRTRTRTLVPVLRSDSDLLRAASAGGSVPPGSSQGPTPAQACGRDDAPGTQAGGGTQQPGEAGGGTQPGGIGTGTPTPKEGRSYADAAAASGVASQGPGSGGAPAEQS